AGAELIEADRHCVHCTTRDTQILIDIDAQRRPENVASKALDPLAQWGDVRFAHGLALGA
ncbi:MAG: hypothetical protein V4637_07705, partial [Pseudomonadota bacterium]